MIVLVIISVVASITSVGALSMRVQANEGSAKTSLKAISGAQEMYHNSAGIYADTLSILGENYIPPDLVAGQKSGYNFVLKSANSGATFTCTAVPVSINYSGVKSYCINALNAISVYINAPSLNADGSDCPSGGIAVSG